MPLFLVAAVAAFQGIGEPADKAAQAYLNQTDLPEKLDRYTRTALSEDTRRHIGNVAIAARIAIEHQLQVRWEF